MFGHIDKSKGYPFCSYEFRQVLENQKKAVRDEVEKIEANRLNARFVSCGARVTLPRRFFGDSPVQRAEPGLHAARIAPLGETTPLPRTPRQEPIFAISPLVGRLSAYAFEDDERPAATPISALKLTTPFRFGC